MSALCGYHGFNYTRDKCVYCGLTAEAYYRLGLSECPRYFARDVGGPQKAALERVLAAVEAKPSRMTKAADDYDTIRQRLAELRLEKRRCTGGCGEPIKGYHKEGCKHTGVVVESETE